VCNNISFIHLLTLARPAHEPFAKGVIDERSGGPASAGPRSADSCEPTGLAGTGGGEAEHPHRVGDKVPGRVPGEPGS